MAKQSFSVGQVLTAAQMTSLQQTAMLGGSATAKTTSYTLVAADAGTVISVNSTSATTITVNTGLFSAGDTVTIQNWGSGAVTITAGTATVNTAGSLIVPQYDGGVLYFRSASEAIYFDFVQAASSASGLTHISTTNIGTTVSSISLPNGTFTSTYNNYRVVFDCTDTTAFSSSGSITINFRYRDNGTDMTGAAYNYQGYEATTALTAIGQSGVTSNRLGKALDATPNRFFAFIDLSGIYTTSQTMHTVHFTGMDGGTNMSGNYGGFEFNPTAYDSMTFFLSTGTMTGGKIRVYGYQKS